MGKPAYQSYLDGKGLEYRGHYIKVKQDFGRDGSGFHLIDGLPCAWGYIVTDGFCDVSPGAAWYATVADAKVAIDILVHVGGEKNSGRFWNIMRRYQERRKALDQIYHTLAEATEPYKPTVVDVAPRQRREDRAARHPRDARAPPIQGHGPGRAIAAVVGRVRVGGGRRARLPRRAQDQVARVMRVMAQAYSAGLLVTPSAVPAELLDLCGGDESLARAKADELRRVGEAWIAAGAELSIQVRSCR